MTTTTAGPPRWICRRGAPSAVVLLLAAALLVALGVYAMVDLLRSPPPPVQYGPFGDVHALFGSALLVCTFVAAGWWAARGVSSRALRRVLVVMLATGPVGWGCAAVDSLGPDLINSAGAAAPLIGMTVLVVAPLVTVAGAVATGAELVRSAATTRPT